jgi:hypothetical protein
MTVRKASAVEEETKLAEWINSTINPYTWQLTGISLYVNLLQEISAATDCLCQIVLNQKFSGKFKKWYKFWSHIKLKSCKKKLHKARSACISAFTLVTLLKEVIIFSYMPHYWMSYCCIPLVLWPNHWKEKVLQVTWLMFNLSFQKIVSQDLEVLKVKFWGVLKVKFWVFNSHTHTHVLTGWCQLLPSFIIMEFSGCNWVYI